jgi:hypothetical protein
MKTNKTIIISSVFITLEIILAILIQFTHNYLNIFVSYLSIALAAAFPLFFIKNKNNLLVQVGLLFTLFADLFLVVIKPMLQVPAMICFSITQTCYFLRIYYNQTSKKERIIHLIIRIISIIIIQIITVIVLKEKTDFLSLISTFYYINLIINIIFAFKQKESSILFPIGLLLFACCDLQVGLIVLNSSYITIENNLILSFILDPPFNLVWLFYVPSQTLIALSIIKDKTSTN